jgi:two-component sensor histidine kinase
MEGRGRRSEDQLSLYDEASLLKRLSEQQSRLVSEVLEQAAQTREVSADNARLASDLAGSRDRLQEVHHRIRNHLQTVVGLLASEQAAETSPGARRALQRSVARVASIAAIHDLLARDPATGDLRLPSLAEQLARHLISQAGAEQRLKVRTEICPMTLSPRRATAVVLILTELLCNAIEHGFPSGESGDILLRVARQDADALLEVHDTGRGLPAGFDLARVESLGLRLVSRLAERDLGGRATAHDAGGACFRVVFPASGGEGEE